MFVAKTISSGHNDLIHDVSFDYHGKRMATCSSDQTVKVSISFVTEVVYSSLLVCLGVYTLLYFANWWSV